MARSSSPTHGWLISNRIMRWFAWAMMVLLFLMILFGTAVGYSISRDCNNVYQAQLGIFGYWVHVQVGSQAEGCPDQ